MDAKRAGLVALVEAYKVRVGGASVPNNDVLLRYVLQQISNPHGAKSLAATLDEVPGTVQLKPSELIDLLQKAFEVDELRRRLKASEEEATYFLKVWNDAKRKLDAKPDGKKRKDRYPDALYEFGLVGEPNRKDRHDPKFKNAAERYFFLRTGGHTFKDGIATPVAPRSHDEAVQVVMDEFGFNDWATLEKAWTRIEKSTGQVVKPSYDAEVYPIKSRTYRPPVRK